MKLSIMQKKVIIILAGLLIAALSFFLVFQKNLEKTEEVNREISKHKSQVSYLQNLEPKVIEMKESEPLWDTEIGTVTQSFPCYLSTEDMIYQLYQFQQDTAVNIMNASFQTPSRIFVGGQVSHPFITVEGNSSIAVDGSAELSEVEKNPTKQVDFNAMVGLVNPVQLSLDTFTEEQLFTMTDWIAEHKDKISLSEIALASSEGKLAGTMTVNFFNLCGNGRGYEPLNVSGVQTGIKNIFHTSK